MSHANFVKKIFYPTATTALLLNTLLLTACGDDQAYDESKKKALTVTTVTAQIIDEVIIRPAIAYNVVASNKVTQQSFSGVVQAGKESQLSFRVSGTVKSVYAKVGSYVKKGSYLAKLDTTDYGVSTSQSMANFSNIQANEQASKANSQQAKAEFMRAQASYKRAEKLYETDTISTSEFEQARTGYLVAQASYESSQLQVQSAQSQVAAASQQLKASKNQLAYTGLRAPYSGYVSQVFIRESEQIGAGQPAIVLSNNVSTDVEVGMPASLINGVRKGDRVVVKFNNFNGRTVAGKVTKVGFSAANTAVYPVVVKLAKSYKSIRPGMMAKVVFTNKKSNQASNIVVPATAISTDKTGRFVYRLLAVQGKNKTYNGKQLYLVKRQAVTMGTLSKQGFIITKGLAVGDTIAQAGLNVIQEGDLVTRY